MAKAEKKEQPKLGFRDKAKELDKQFSSVEHDRSFVPSGSIYFNWGLGGGYQTGRLYELISWEGGGKTTLALHALAECQALGNKAVYIDSEHALDETYAKAIGVDWDNQESLTIFQPDNGEDGFEYAKAMMETGEVRLVVIDSINGMLPKKMLEDPAGSSNLGLHARLMGQEIPKLKVLASKYDVAVICISQVREKIGVMFGSPETTQGGHALKFWASVRVDLRKELDKEGEEVVGIYSKFKIIKNKVVAPYRKGKIPIVFGVGIDKLQEVLDLGKEAGLFRPYGQSTFFEGTKYLTTDLVKIIEDTPELKEKINLKITEYLNGTAVAEEPAAEAPTEQKTNK
jgi:recombination protein RecA